MNCFARKGGHKQIQIDNNTQPQRKVWQRNKTATIIETTMTTTPTDLKETVVNDIKKPQ